VEFWVLTDSESGSEASYFEVYFEEEGGDQQQQQQASAEVETQAATVDSSNSEVALMFIDK
jgi:hypothetical protein